MRQLATSRRLQKLQILVAEQVEEHVLRGRLVMSLNCANQHFNKRLVSQLAAGTPASVLEEIGGEASLPDRVAIRHLCEQDGQGVRLGGDIHPEDLMFVEHHVEVCGEWDFERSFNFASLHLNL